MKAVFAMAILSVISTGAMASDVITAKVSKASPVMLDIDGRSTELKLATPIASIELWGDMSNAFIRTKEGLNAPTTKCGENLGRLAEPLILKAKLSDGSIGNIMIPARGASVYQNGGCSSDGSPKVLQIDLKDRTRKIMIDTNGKKMKSFLEIQKFEAIAITSKMEWFKQHIADRDYSAARKIYSEIRKETLLSNETRLLLEVRATMPALEQPIDTTKDFVSEDLSSLVGRDVNAMTMAEYLTYFTKYFSTFRNEDSKVDQTYAFRLLDVIGAPQDASVKMLMTASETSLDGIIAFGKAGGGKKQLSFKPQFLLSQALVYLSYAMPQQEFQIYLATQKTKTQKVMAADANVAALFEQLYFESEIDLTK